MINWGDRINQYCFLSNQIIPQPPPKSVTREKSIGFRGEVTEERNKTRNKTRENGDKMGWLFNHLVSHFQRKNSESLLSQKTKKIFVWRRQEAWWLMRWLIDLTIPYKEYRINQFCFLSDQIIPQPPPKSVTWEKSIGFLGTFEHLNIGKLELMNTWTFEHWNIGTLKRWNIWSF